MLVAQRNIRTAHALPEHRVFHFFSHDEILNSAYAVLFLQGGATAQFAAIPLNLTPPDQRVVKEAGDDYEKYTALLEQTFARYAHRSGAMVACPHNIFPGNWAAMMTPTSIPTSSKRLGLTPNGRFITVTMIGGNHDAWGGKFLSEAVGMRVHDGLLRTILGGRAAQRAAARDPATHPRGTPVTAPRWLRWETMLAAVFLAEFVLFASISPYFLDVHTLSDASFNFTERAIVALVRDFVDREVKPVVRELEQDLEAYFGDNYDMHRRMFPEMSGRSGEPVQRYERDQPGELLHIDIKKLGRIERPGHRVTGTREGRVQGAGWEFLYVAVDDHSRVAFTQMYPDERKESAIGFLDAAATYYASLGMPVQRLITDNGPAFHSKAFVKRCRELEISQKFTRTYRPQTNGKAERFIQSALREWAYGHEYQHSDQRRAALPLWNHFYNWHRQHHGIGLKPPMSRISATNNLLTLHS